MSKRTEKSQSVRIYLTDEENEKLQAIAERVNLPRSKIMLQIFRKYVGLPSALQDSKFYKQKEAAE